MQILTLYRVDYGSGFTEFNSMEDAEVYRASKVFPTSLYRVTREIPDADVLELLDEG